MLDFYQFKHFKNYTKLMHAVTTKSITLPYSFSLALHTGEDVKSIIKNRKILAQYLDVEKAFRFVVANQTHSCNIVQITIQETKGWEKIDDAIENCDALITDVPHVLLNILTADCVPILLYDREHHAIAAIHAGWKGTKSEIAKKTVHKMQALFNSNPREIIAGIAPSIGHCCYEVGGEVAKHFSHIPHAYKEKGKKYMLDLPYINKMQLIHAGIDENHIEVSNICTACDTKHFFSYRKEHGCSGRFMSIIGLKDT